MSALPSGWWYGFAGPEARRRLAIALALVAPLVLADQALKAWAGGRLALGDAQPLTSWLNLALAHNRGAAFSFLSDAGGWQSGLFLAIGLAASVLLLALIARGAGGAGTRLALTLILSGAVGNIVDRVRQGYVVDFVDFHVSWLGGLFPGGHFPAFNLADSAITCGAALLIFEEFRRGRRS